MAKTIWVLDPTHSAVHFSVKHMMFTTVRGNFKQFDLKFSHDDDSFDQANIEFEAMTASIDTGNADRDNHLKNADFFDHTRFPKLHFLAKGMKQTGEHQYIIDGELTIRDITRPLQVPVNASGIMKDPWGNSKIGFSAELSINRKDFGLNWNAALEAGGWLVSDEVKIELEFQMSKQS